MKSDEDVGGSGKEGGEVLGRCRRYATGAPSPEMKMIVLCRVVSLLALPPRSIFENGTPTRKAGGANCNLCASPLEYGPHLGTRTGQWLVLQLLLVTMDTSYYCSNSTGNTILGTT